MAYTKTNWANDNPPPLDATNLMKIEDKLEELDARPSGGGASEWNAISATLTYASADSPTFVANTSVNLTSVISVGMKIKLTQTTVKYFIVTAITSTTITLYGGTDYTLANATITLPYVSSMKSPFGFPMNPDKWSVIVTDTTSRNQSTPTQGTWYNLGSLSISIPIGLWGLSYSLMIACTRTTASLCSVQVTLSTSNSSSTDGSMTRATEGGALTQLGFNSIECNRPNPLNLSSKTIYYLNLRTNTAGNSAIYEGNDTQSLIIKAVCAHL